MPFPATRKLPTPDLEETLTVRVDEGLAEGEAAGDAEADGEVVGERLGEGEVLGDGLEAAGTVEVAGVEGDVAGVVEVVVDEQPTDNARIATTTTTIRILKEIVFVLMRNLH